MVKAEIASLDQVAAKWMPRSEVRGGERWTVLVDDLPLGAEAFAHSVGRGLSDHPRWLHCRYLYDAAGSEIFLKITEQPEYYPTRAEREILLENADAVRAIAGDTALVELGAGTADKTRYLLAAWCRASAAAPVAYVPVDIDATVLTEAAARLAREFPDLVVTGLATSYERGLDFLRQSSPVCLVFLGSTIGNFNPDETDAFLGRLATALTPDDTLLLGVDLVKDPATLEAAYNDAVGWSEAFTRNLFTRMNRELGTRIPVESIEHVAYWNDRLERIEIYARFLEQASIELAAIGRRFRIAAGEMILTEISRKYRHDKIAADLARFGFRLEATFLDSLDRFAVLLFRPLDVGREREGAAPWVRLAAELQRIRRRTHDLIDSLTDEQLHRIVMPILSPIAWDLGHTAEFEELWLVRMIDALREGRPVEDSIAEMYDAARTPRSERGTLELPDRDAILRRLRVVRQSSLSRLREASLDGRDRLLRDGFVWRMLAQHEAQHQETILQAIARMDDLAYEPATRIATPRTKLPPDTTMVVVPAGPFPLGEDDPAVSYDNERPRHWVEVPAFWADTAPVTNGDFALFVEAGGYARREWWSEQGWKWLEREPVEHPLGWRRDSRGGWEEVHFGQVEPLVPTRPVIHVSWYEADAYARSVGKRLLTEIEWEKAAAWDPERRIAHRCPWGDEPPESHRANLDARTFAPAPVGAYPAGRSFYGCHQMIGDVWEWTASEFEPYPGFEPFPYPEYSAIHFGKGYKVLRGGSWATSSIVARNTFRNWDLPQRRQIFAGFRCARDA
ncbi:MAG: ergothioneine biosynthesis protein EgtB [Gemmatimonadota bacterium]